MVTVTVEGSTEVEVTNLTPAAKETTVTLEATASATGPGVRGLVATLTESDSAELDPDDPVNFAVDGSADEPMVVTAPAALTRFVGTGTVTFDVTGLVGVDVQGPATWRSRGALDATATVTVEYEFTATPTSTTTSTTTTTPTSTTTSTTTTTTVPNDPPVAVDDTATVVEDDPATAIDVLANDTDPDGGPITIDSATDPANGTVVVTAGGDRPHLRTGPELLQRPARDHPRHVHLHARPRRVDGDRVGDGHLCAR